MQFQLSRASACGIILSLCSLNAIADDSTSQGSSFGSAIGSLLNGYINSIQQPTNTNSDSPATPESSTQEQFNHTAPMNAEDQVLMAKGLWHDPRTGLIWSLCRVGETWNGSGCDGKPTQLDWIHAMFAAKESKLAGYNDWRLPSFSEYAGIIKCPTGFDESDFGRSYEKKLNESANDINGVVIKSCNPISDQGREAYLHILPNYFSYKSPLDSRYYDVSKTEFLEWTSTYKLDMSKTHYFPITTDGNGGMPEFTSPNLTARLVRGGNSTNTYPQALQMASAFLKIPLLRAKAAQTQKAELTRRTTLLRQNVKEGDKTAQGLVIEVRGSLVKLQTYKRVCTMMSTTHDPYCVESHVEVGGEEWVNRNNLTPVQ